MSQSQSHIRHRYDADAIRAQHDIVDLARQDVPHGRLIQQGGYYQALCPFHDERNPSLSIDPRAQRYRCHGCGKAGDIIQWVMDRDGVTFPEACATLGGEREIDHTTSRIPTPRPAPPPRPTPAYTATDADTVYRWLLPRMPLSTQHREQLMARRGTAMSAEQMDAMIEREAYGTVPADVDLSVMGYELAREIGTMGPTARSVPGVGGTGGGAKIGLTPGALVVPVRDADGRIVALRQRIVGSDGKKAYIYPTGTRPAVHHPVRVPGRQYADGVVCITEGEIKAAIAAAMTDTYTISVPGAAFVEAAVQAVRALGASAIRVAYDMDWQQKSSVSGHLVAMIQALRDEAGIGVDLAYWGGVHKGLDDALTASQEVKTVHVDDELLAELTQHHQELLERDRATRAAPRQAQAADTAVPTPHDADTTQPAHEDPMTTTTATAQTTATVTLMSIDEAIAALPVPVVADDADLGLDLGGGHEEARDIEAQLAQMSQMSAADLLGDQEVLQRARILLDHGRMCGAETVRALGQQRWSAILEICQKLDSLPSDEARLELVRAVRWYLSHTRSEIGVAHRITEIIRDRAMYVHGDGWYYYDSVRWAKDSKEASRVRQLIERAILAMYDSEYSAVKILTKHTIYGPNIDAKRLYMSEDSRKTPESVEIEEHAKWLQKLCTERVIGSTLKLILPWLTQDSKRLDSLEYRHLLVAQNGIIDLRTGELIPHSPKYLITKAVSCAYDPEAKCPVFEKFTAEILAEADKTLDPEYYAYIQRVFGYSIWGDAREEVIFFLDGPGGNGKSKLLETVFFVMGSYAKAIKPNLLLDTGESSAHGPEPTIVALKGIRYVMTSEPKRGAHMDEGVVKQLTGRDTITARNLYENDEIELQVVGKFFISCNEKPRIKGTERGIWRRQEVIDPKHIWRTEKDTDPDLQHLPMADMELDDKLRAEAQGILAWLVRGCLEWQKMKLCRPPRALAAIQAYRGENDRVMQFLQDCTERRDGHSSSVGQSELYRIYQMWCEESGSHPLAKDRFGAAMRDHRMQEGRTGPIGRTWRGIVIIPEVRDRLMSRTRGWGGSTGGGGGDWVPRQSQDPEPTRSATVSRRV
ncbi:MAG: phage/plasmid primase, P4 family [Niveispirillum sp.]|uniref:phage/plasmid primase, P4 family n=1 Tax=Niveispirillum sp. TaxID=1917217 RepID=UPI0040370584